MCECEEPLYRKGHAHAVKVLGGTLKWVYIMQRLFRLFCCVIIFFFLLWDLLLAPLFRRVYRRMVFNVVILKFVSLRCLLELYWAVVQLVWVVCLPQTEDILLKVTLHLYSVCFSVAISALFYWFLGRNSCLFLEDTTISKK